MLSSHYPKTCFFRCFRELSFSWSRQAETADRGSPVSAGLILDICLGSCHHLAPEEHSNLVLAATESDVRMSHMSRGHAAAGGQTVGMGAISEGHPVSPKPEKQQNL